MKLFYLLLLVEVVSGSLISSFKSCFSQNGLLDGQNTLYYSKRCRSFKKTLACMSDAVNSPYLTWMETYAAEKTIDTMKTNVGRACALARNLYCSSIYLDGKMKSCTMGFSQSSLNNLTEEYANLHYGTLVNSLNCMEREIRVCPDNEHIQTYLTGIQTWRAQLNQLSQAYQRGPGLKPTSPKGLGLKPTSPKDPGWIVNGGTVHFGISTLVMTILVILF